MADEAPEKKSDEYFIEEKSLRHLRNQVSAFTRDCKSMKTYKIKDTEALLQSDINWFAAIYKIDDKELAWLEEWSRAVRESVEGEEIRRREMAEKQKIREAVKKELLQAQEKTKSEKDRQQIIHDSWVDGPR